MIDKKGYPVIVDFGCAKIIRSGQTFTFCGTPDYTCPEMISNQGHGFGADHWALGILIYEMLSGENPFFYDGISNLQLLNDICNNDPYPLDDTFTVEARDLVVQLLKKDPDERIGSKGGKAILDHSWFEGAGDLQKARAREIPAPWIPLLGNDSEPR